MSPGGWSRFPQKGQPAGRHLLRQGLPPVLFVCHGQLTQAQSLGRGPGPGAESVDTCVPSIGAGCPGQLRGKGAEQVEEGPSEDDDVVDVQIGLDDHGRQTDACGRRGAWGATGESERPS